MHADSDYGMIYSLSVKAKQYQKAFNSIYLLNAQKTHSWLLIVGELQLKINPLSWLCISQVILFLLKLADSEKICYICNEFSLWASTIKTE